MCMDVLAARVSVHHVCAHKGQKRVSESLGLELRMVVSGSASAGNQASVFKKSSQCLSPFYFSF